MLFLRLHTARFFFSPHFLKNFLGLVLMCVRKYTWSRVSLPQGDFKFKLHALKNEYLIMKLFKVCELKIGQ